MYSLEPDNSSLISCIDYYDDTEELTIRFKKYYVDELTYVDVPLKVFMAFSETTSFSKFYLRGIKPIFTIKTTKMADKILKCKIDVKKLNKDWFFVGEKGTYLNFTVLYNEGEDSYGNNGMLVQDVPTVIYKKDKTVKGEILGNCKEFSKSDGGSEESKPGVESGKMGVDGLNDDLPF